MQQHVPTVVLCSQDNSGQARVTLIAGLTTGEMRVTAEAPPSLNISTGVTVQVTN